MIAQKRILLALAIGMVIFILPSLDAETRRTILDLIPMDQFRSMLTSMGEE